MVTHRDSEWCEEAPAEDPPVLVAVPCREAGGLRDHHLDVSDEAENAVGVSDGNALQQSEEKHVPASGVRVQDVQHVGATLEDTKILYGLVLCSMVIQDNIDI